jgi:2-iminobutanoate/2-iminopropanoate deaminase
MATDRRMVTEIRCAAAPPPGGHYAQAVLHRDTLYVSGQLGVSRETSDVDKVSIADQVTFALRNIEAIGRVVGAQIDDIVRCTVYVVDIAHWDEANRAYAAFFGAHRPARSVVPCGPLHFGALIEIEAVVAAGARPAAPMRFDCDVLAAAWTCIGARDESTNPSGALKRITGTVRVQ